MLVDQIDMQAALELAAKGKEIRILYPTCPGGEWKDLMPDTLQNMLEGCLFFLPVLEVVNQKLEDAAQGGDKSVQNTPPEPLMKQLENLPLAPRNRPASVWVPVANGNRLMSEKSEHCTGRDGI